MTGRRYLGEFEQMLLLTVLRLGHDAYGMSIRRELAAEIDRKMSRSAVYITLDRLEQKGLVRSVLGDPSPTRGGRAKRYFTVTPSGLDALRASRHALVTLWSKCESLLGDG